MTSAPASSLWWAGWMAMAMAVMKLALDVQGPPDRPLFRTCLDVCFFGNLLQSEAEGLPQALDPTHLADQSEHLRRIQPLTGVASYQTGFHQSVENCLESQRSQSVGFKTFTETRQRARMESIVPKLAVEDSDRPRERGMLPGRRWRRASLEWRNRADSWAGADGPETNVGHAASQ